MSHSLHRYGSVEGLKKDFCIYARAARGINRDNCGGKLRQILHAYMNNNVVNFGSSHSGKSYKAGLDPKEYEKTLDNSYGVISSFADRDDVKGVLEELKNKDLGISIVVSGLIEEIKKIAKEVGLKPHSATLSLGIYGKKSLLPEEEILEITTMCGHSLIGNSLAKRVIKDVKDGIIDPEKGAMELARPCTCGIVNTNRCRELLENQIKEKVKKS